MVGSTDVSALPLGNAPFPLQVRHICAELRVIGETAAGGSCGGSRELRASDRWQTEPPKKSPMTGVAALLASTPQMLQLWRSYSPPSAGSLNRIVPAAW